ncbi:MAG: hypothetical protein HC892_08420 [Saprospiraceae bacterium]|nr:hypothetical protein [Saprospiraceae bacterium]
MTRCKGEGYEWNNQVYSSDTTVCQLYSNPTGCDTMNCFTLRYAQSYVQRQNYNFCVGQRQQVQGVEVNSDTTFCVLYSSIGGCDSLVCADVNYLSSPRSAQTISICEGQTYNFQGQILSQAGIYLDTLATVKCDSVVALQLNVLPTYELKYDIIIKQGERLIFNNESFNETGTYTFDYQTKAGCDSLLILNLTVEPDSATTTWQVQNEAYFATTLISKLSGSFRIDAVTAASDLHRIDALQIFDVNGIEVFSALDLPLGSIAWQPHVAGLYFFQALVSATTQQPTRLLGKVLVVD